MHRIVVLLATFLLAVAMLEGADHLSAAREFHLHGDLPAAEREFQAAIAEAKNQGIRGQDHANALAFAGVFYQDIGRFSKAETCFRQALKIQTERAADDARAIAPLVSHLAELYVETGHFSEAKRLNLPSWVDRVRAADPDSKYLAPLFEAIGAVFSSEGRFAEARQAFYSAFDLMPDNSEYPVAMAGALNNFGLVCMRAARFEEALAHFRAGLMLTAGVLPADDLRSATNRENLADAYMRLGRYADAERCFAEALAVIERRCGPKSLRTAEVLARYARLLHEEKSEEAARQLETRARLIREESSSDAILGSAIDFADLSKWRR